MGSTTMVFALNHPIPSPMLRTDKQTFAMADMETKAPNTYRLLKYSRDTTSKMVMVAVRGIVTSKHTENNEYTLKAYTITKRHTGVVRESCKCLGISHIYGLHP